MASTTNPKGMQTPTATTTAGGENRQDAQKRHHIESIFVVLGLFVFLASGFVIHAHPKPYSFDLAAAQAVQGIHYPGWLEAVLKFPSVLNDPVPSAVALISWFVFMMVMALIFRLRRKSPATWLLAGVFLVLTVMSSAGINVLADEIIGRPRPNPKLYPIHVYTPIVPFPSYPSGHTEHDIAYYGFLLYLSFTKPVREWRYHWLLLPLQLYAVYDLIVIGYSRILEGDHWFTDILGGYLEGAICLVFFIFLYRWTTDVLAKRRARKHGELVMAR